MNDNFKWKSDKQCHECRVKQRQEIMKEIQELAGCKKCQKFNKIRDTDLRRKENR